MLKGLFILNDYNFELIYGSVHEEISNHVDICAEPQSVRSIQENTALLLEADVIFSGWGGPVFDEALLRYAPRLKAVFYGAGSVKFMLTDTFWDRGILLTSAYAANAIPVAEYTLSQILFSLKRGWHYVRNAKNRRRTSVLDEVPGAFGSTIGIVSLGMIGRKVCELLKPFDVHVIAYDPFVSKEDAAGQGVELCSLAEVFQRADVVSLHTPRLPETEGLITGAHFASMKKNASFINTSRGSIVREEEMIDVLQRRTDLYAVLDVTEPEPPAEGSPFFDMDNVILTPHIAGSMAAECQRMGKYMLDELVRYLNGEPLKWQITREKAAILA